MYRHSPLMRSLLSQSQTPTAPRRAVGFFRSGRLAGCPARLITQSTSGPQVLLRCPFQPSTETTLTEKQKTSTQTIGAIGLDQPVHNEECKWLLGVNLFTGELNSSRFCTNAAQRWGRRQNDEREPNNRLDDGTVWAHLSKKAAERKKFRGGATNSHVSQKTARHGGTLPFCVSDFHFALWHPVEL